MPTSNGTAILGKRKGKENTLKKTKTSVRRKNRLASAEDKMEEP